MNAIQKLGEALSRRSAIPLGVWALGGVSLLMDISSEMIHALLPIYLVTVMGASMEAVGVIEGVAEATASIVKVFSGALSDWLGQRKLLAALGYGLAALTKPIFPLAALARLGRGGALHRPRRQGHSRRAARRADRRHHAGRTARRGLRPAPGARHGRRLRRAADRHRADGGDRRRIPRRCSGSRSFRRFSPSRCWSRWSRSRRRKARRAKRGRPFDRAALQRGSAAPIGWSSPSRRCSRWRASPRRSWCCASRASVCRWRWRR